MAQLVASIGVGVVLLVLVVRDVLVDHGRVVRATDELGTDPLGRERMTVQGRGARGAIER